jgi:hypothetical protein
VSQSIIWIMGGMFGLLGLVGLLQASRAHGGAMYWVGIFIFVACVLVIFYFIHKAFSERH